MTWIVDYITKNFTKDCRGVDKWLSQQVLILSFEGSSPSTPAISFLTGVLNEENCPGLRILKPGTF